MLDNRKCSCSRHVIPVSSCLLYFMYMLNHSSASENSVLLPSEFLEAEEQHRILRGWECAGTLRSLPRAEARHLADKWSAEGAQAAPRTYSWRLELCQRPLNLVRPSLLFLQLGQLVFVVESTQGWLWSIQIQPWGWGLEYPHRLNQFSDKLGVVKPKKEVHTHSMNQGIFLHFRQVFVNGGPMLLKLVAVAAGQNF